MKKLIITSSLTAVLIVVQAAALAAQDMGGMKGMPMEGTVHMAKGTVKKIDKKAGVVSLAHGPVKSMNWPPMSMGFKVRDKSLLDKLTEGSSVEFEFVQSGKDYVLTSVK